MNAQVANTQVQHTRLEEPKSTMSGSRASHRSNEEDSSHRSNEEDSSHRSNEEDSVSESTGNNTAEGGALPVALDADDVGKADPYEHERVSVKKTSCAWENHPYTEERSNAASQEHTGQQGCWAHVWLRLQFVPQQGYSVSGFTNLATPKFSLQRNNTPCIGSQNER
jgi:hypothetical protein